VTSSITPPALPSAAALTQGNNTAGAAVKSADTPTGSGNQDRASIFIVEVVGYGGGDGSQQPTGSVAQPATGNGAQPATGSGTQPATGSGAQPAAGDDAHSDSNSSKKRRQ
jgi:hypothetical protein